MNDLSVSSPQSDDTGLNNDIETAETETPDAETAEIEAVATSDDVIDLDAIERDLTDVQAALERLNDGSYWTDEITGDALPDEVLASFPLTRTVAGSPAT